MQRREPFEEETAEQARQHVHRQEEAGLAGDPARPVRQQAAARDDAMDMRMMGQRRAPRVQYGVRPMRAPGCFGSAAMVIGVSAEVLNRRS